MPRKPRKVKGVKDSGWKTNFFGEIAKLAELEVKVGITAGKSGQGMNHENVSADDYEDGTTVAEVAVWNEFGTKHIPERPFMRQAYDKNGAVIEKMMAIQARKVEAGQSAADEALRAIGAMHVGLIQHEIRSGDFAENKDSTKKRKESSAPLIDNGRLIQSIHYVVESKTGGKE